MNLKTVASQNLQGDIGMLADEVHYLDISLSSKRWSQILSARNDIWSKYDMSSNNWSKSTVTGLLVLILLRF